ncbi:MAG TPA: MFS transporter [Steroidobacteraceae bacterium]|nr:MFS transporter [Steroidobacteraceae bacterium]
MSTSTITYAQSAAANEDSAALRWYVLLLMCLVYTLSITDRYMVTQVLDPIRRELKLTDSGVGLLTGPSLALFYVILGFPISWLIDRSSRRNIISVSIIAWSAMTLCTGLSRTSWQFLLSRIGIGIGEAGGTPGANSIISDYFPAARRPMALTVFSLGAPIGAYFASDTTGAIADLHGWRAPFLWLGAPGVIVGLLIYLTVKEPRRGKLDAVLVDKKPSFLDAMIYLWSQRSAVHVMVASALTALWGWGLMYWTPTFLIRSYGLSPGEAGAITGPIHLYGGVAATLYTSWLLTRPSMADPRRIVQLMGWWIGLATAVSLVIYTTHSLALTRWLFWLFIPSIYFYIGPCFGMLLNLAEPRMRAVFCAATLFVANVGNLIVAPVGVGLLSDWFAPGHGAPGESLRLAMLCLVPTGFWATYHYFRSVGRLAQDQERATGVAVRPR